MDGFEQMLTKRSRRHFRVEVVPYVDDYDISVVPILDATHLRKGYELYRHLKAKNLDINNFGYDYSLFEAMNNSPFWQFLLVRKKNTAEICGMMFCYVNQANNSFNPVLIGMQPEEEGRLVLYRQCFFRLYGTRKAKDIQKFTSVFLLFLRSVSLER